MTNKWAGIVEQLQSGETITPESFLIEIRRIADALETIAGGQPHCDGVNPETGEECVLDAMHVGYHQPRDGRKPWLDAW